MVELEQNNQQSTTCNQSKEELIIHRQKVCDILETFLTILNYEADKTEIYCHGNFSNKEFSYHDKGLTKNVDLSVFKNRKLTSDNIKEFQRDLQEKDSDNFVEKLYNFFKEVEGVYLNKNTWPIQDPLSAYSSDITNIIKKSYAINSPNSESDTTTSASTKAPNHNNASPNTGVLPPVQSNNLIIPLVSSENYFNEISEKFKEYDGNFNFRDMNNWLFQENRQGRFVRRPIQGINQENQTKELNNLIEKVANKHILKEKRNLYEAINNIKFEEKTPINNKTQLSTALSRIKVNDKELTIGDDNIAITSDSVTINIRGIDIPLSHDNKLILRKEGFFGEYGEVGKPFSFYQTGLADAVKKKNSKEGVFTKLKEDGIEPQKKDGSISYLRKNNTVVTVVDIPSDVKKELDKEYYNIKGLDEEMREKLKAVDPRLISALQARNTGAAIFLHFQLFQDPDYTGCSLGSEKFKLIIDYLCQTEVDPKENFTPKNEKYYDSFNKGPYFAQATWAIKKNGNSYTLEQLKFPEDAVPIGTNKNYLEDFIDEWEKKGCTIRNKYCGKDFHY
ncbi:MAG: hypothetical protein LBD57_02720 [Endomicrobium sp.]|jgi:hypothetical protein|uniref:hypothetical protein n=1 Tax=Candidatus Endomicrobiellum cubanum TaxID=3242325 RepID=UPI0028273F0E|nr:hypothetical protein [Endomicrobium sp.]